MFCYRSKSKELAFYNNVYNVMECPCSSLAIHCCQFGYGIRNLPVFDSLNSSLILSPEDDQGGEHSSWMTFLRKVAPPTLLLGNIVMPGSHDSASYTIPKWKAFSGVGQTQNKSIREQMQAGIRYFDVRLGKVNSRDHELGIVHGCLSGGTWLTVEQILQDVADFCTLHPGEFIVLEMVLEYGHKITPKERYNLLVLMKEILGPHNACATRNPLTLLQTPLVELQESVCLLLHPRIYEDFVEKDTEEGEKVWDQDTIASTFGFYSSGVYMRNHWHNTRQVPQLLEWNLQEVRYYRQPQGSGNVMMQQWLTNQFVLTPGVGGVRDVLDLLLGRKSLRPIDGAFHLAIPQERLQEHVDNAYDDFRHFAHVHADESWNIIMMDFIDIIPSLISFWIHLNFTQAKISIVKASCRLVNGGDNMIGLDVTDSMSNYIVRRDSVLHLTNVVTDLDLLEKSAAGNKCDGILSVCYQLETSDGGEEGLYHLLEVPFHQDEPMEIILGQYSHMKMMEKQDQNIDCCVTTLDTNVNNEGGVFYGGKIITLEELEINKSDKVGCLVWNPEFQFDIVAQD